MFLPEQQEGMVLPFPVLFHQYRNLQVFPLPFPEEQAQRKQTRSNNNNSARWIIIVPANPFPCSEGNLRRSLFGRGCNYQFIIIFLSNIQNLDNIFERDTFIGMKGNISVGLSPSFCFKNPLQVFNIYRLLFNIIFQIACNGDGSQRFCRIWLLPFGSSSFSAEG